jgi:glutaconate CoA-transferase subunit B
MNEYSFTKCMMVLAGAREIGNDDCVFVGMRLPLLSFQLAKEIHAPNATGIFETGVLRDRPALEPILTMGDLPNIAGALWTTSLIDIMGLLQSGRVTLGFLGGAQVDRFGNVNTTGIGPYSRPKVRLPGSGGAADIASMAQRFVVVVAHERNRLPRQVDFITSPGFGRGGSWREDQGLLGGGPSAIITSRCVMRFDPRTSEAYLHSVHPGVTVEEILANMDWPLVVPERVDTTPIPQEHELDLIRKYDPDGFWTK